MPMLLSATASAANAADNALDPPASLAEMGAQFHALIHAILVWIAHNALRIAIAAAIGTLVVLALLAIRTAAVRLCRQPADQPPTVRAVIGRVTGRTGFWFIIVLTIELLIRYTGAPPLLDRTVYIFWVVLSVSQMALWLRELIIGMVEHRAGIGDQDNSSLGSAVGIIRLLVTVSLTAVAIILILDNLGVNVTGLIAGLGIGGIAIGLAAKGIFDDLFAALAILFDGPFRRGDTVQWDSASGTVQSIGLKTTRIRATTGEEVIVSNASLLAKELHNMTQLDYRQASLPFAVIYELPPAKQRAIPALVEAIVAATPECTLVRCGITGFGDSGVNYELLVNIIAPTYADFAAARASICLAMLEKFAEEDIAFSYPTQTTYTAAPDGRLIMPWAAPKE